MNYSTGESVKLGDNVSLDNDSEGVVVIVFDTGEYSFNYPEAQWGDYLKKGVMILFPKHGLIYYEDTIEPDVKFIARGKAFA